MSILGSQIGNGLAGLLITGVVLNENGDRPKADHPRTIKLDHSTGADQEDVLAQLSEQLGRQETVVLLDQFMSENDGLVALLDEPILGSEARLRVAAHVHKSAGSASVYRTEELGSCLKKQETVLRDADGGQLPTAARDFEDAWSRTRVALQISRTSLLQDAGDGDAGQV